ncbi:hypothetical protein BGZ67_002544 [Mortierella alpina]|nr:hypothetical protein BGZ67_002544 [Mortierella alpina]
MYPFSTTATALLFSVAYFTSCLAASDDIPLRALYPSRDRTFGIRPEQPTLTKDVAFHGPTTDTSTPPPPAPALFATIATLDSKAADRPYPTRFRITKTQLESFLGLALDTLFTLEVISDEDPDSRRSDQQHVRVLGKIPVHLRVKELQIGGVSIPRLQAESVNAKMGGVNYGNIQV